MLGGAELVEVSSDGVPGDKARFVRGVEQALLSEKADIGVHSAKDLPAELTEGLTLAAVPPREDAHDAWVGVGSSLEDVPEGARVGTASLRRRAQLLAARPDLRVEDLHGNVDTRLRKLSEGELDGIVLAVAGLRRLGREDEIAFAIPAEAMVPTAGQGALILQVRAGDEAATEAATRVGDAVALRELSAERATVALLEADCTSPIGVRASAGGVGGGAAAAAGESTSGSQMQIEGFVGLPDGSEWVRDRLDGDAAEPEALGRQLAKRLLSAGAREILDRAGAMA
jgi:hydroxymethylbilane synthase